MKKCVFILIITAVLLISFLRPVNVQAADVTGEWVLSTVDDKEAVDYTSPDDRDYRSVVDYIYTRAAYNMEGQTQWKEDDTDYSSSHTVSAVFTGLPERIKPNEKVTIIALMQSSASTDYPDIPDVTDEYPPCAWIKYAGIAQNTESYEYIYQIPANNYNSVFNKTQTVSFTLPDGDLNNYVTMWVEFGLSNPAFIELKGLVRSVENKPMPWMRLQAYVYYNTEKYDGIKSPDIVIDGKTDHMGRYLLNIPTQPGDTKPVGILLVGTLTCIYPYDAGQNLFFFVDMKDSYSQTNNQISVSTWIVADPAELGNPDKPEDPLRIYRLLAYYNLGLDAWSFNEELLPDPVYFFSTESGQAQNLQNYSMLYTAAYDAWFFGAGILKEETDLISHPIRIEVRWPVAGNLDTSHFSYADLAIRLTELDSKRDDNSRFTILHEFGHAFDCISNGSAACRALSGMGANDTYHGGYFNSSTSASYIEGFATFYAGMVQLFSGYSNPGVLDWITLTTPSSYVAWGSNGASEELAIASLLYYTHPLTGDIGQYWSQLKPDRLNLYEYYQSLEQYLSGKSASLAAQFSDYAFEAGLYKMPFGNGQYDPGEPFQDLPDAANNKNSQYDINELYADLMFAVGSDGTIDPGQPIQPFTKQNIVIGASGDALRVRKTIQKPQNGYLYLTGELPEYLLVTITCDTGDARRLLRAVDGNRIFIGLPDTKITGTLEVSVPGGNVIYTGNLAELQQLQEKTAGQTIPLASANISAYDLAAPGTQIIATYGEAGASGLLSIPQISYEDIVYEADGYDQNITMDDLSQDKWNESPDRPPDGPDIKSILLILGFIAAGVIIVLILKKRKPHPAAYAPQIPYINHAAPSSQSAAVPTAAFICSHCGNQYSSGSRFCRKCGKLIKVSTFCPICGMQMQLSDKFCRNCGDKKE